MEQRFEVNSCTTTTGPPVISIGFASRCSKIFRVFRDPTHAVGIYFTDGLYKSDNLSRQVFATRAIFAKQNLHASDISDKSHKFRYFDIRVVRTHPFIDARVNNEADCFIA